MEEKIHNLMFSGFHVLFNLGTENSQGAFGYPSL